MVVPAAVQDQWERPSNWCSHEVADFALAEPSRLEEFESFTCENTEGEKTLAP